MDGRLRTDVALNARVAVRLAELRGLLARCESDYAEVLMDWLCTRLRQRVQHAPAALPARTRPAEPDEP
jgi:hypothetical protein